MKHYSKTITTLTIVLILFFGFFLLFLNIPFLTVFVVIFSILLTLQSLITLAWMLHAWNDPEEYEKSKFHTKTTKPFFGFTALLPARHEHQVIRDTINAINSIDYPDNLKELIVICKDDDYLTIEKAKKTISSIGKKNIRIELFHGGVTNKPHALNIGLKKAKFEIVTIFDAEDEPHKDIYKLMNTEFIERKADVIQSGVQLINYKAHWFSALSVMEYFLWFKSGLMFFAKHGGVTPLGGNTVFFKKKWIKRVSGWDEKCLTEDADIGIRLASGGAKTQVVYEEKYATLEETPANVAGFIKQRTRWNQGFMQIFIKDKWKENLNLKQKIFATYILLSPVVQSILFLYVPFAAFVAVTQKLPVWITILSYIPFYLIGLQVLTLCIGLYIFAREYKLKYSLLSSIQIFLTLIPYQILLTVASFRAVYRILSRNNSWEKTLHTNGHRLFPEKSLAVQYVK